MTRMLNYKCTQKNEIPSAGGQGAGVGSSIRLHPTGQVGGGPVHRAVGASP